ncbi:MAG: DotA/TraY family protein [Alphaproteobacteria bacterium]|nr:DotA/TraY family protein [Alphaproteobacteria bacterium]
MATRGQILRYSLLPGILPRFMDIFRSGFFHIASLIAVIYQSVRLLPPNHPYLNPVNFGRFGVRHVVVEAARHLEFNRRNIDQILIFFFILSGLVLLALQFILLIVAVVAEQPAYASSLSSFTQIFNNPSASMGSLGPEQDLAFILMDRVFGVQGIFDSCISNTAISCTDLQGNNLTNTPAAFPFPFHLALHKMLQFYSYGILLVGIFVIIYFATTIVAEAARTGTAFGQRFNRAWMPIRLIVFFALILPISHGTAREGLNPAQIITLYVVKYGSNFATNGWALFNGGLGTAHMAQQKDIVATPNIPEVNGLLQFLYIANTCRAAYHLGYGPSHKIDAYIVRSPPPTAIPSAVNGPALTPDAVLFNTTNFANAADFSMRGNITIRFGTLGMEDPQNAGKLIREFDRYKGNVKPYCGDLMLQISSLTEPGALRIQESYYQVVRDIWRDPDFLAQGLCLVRQHTSYNQDPNCPELPDTDLAEDKVILYKNQIQTAVTNGVNAQIAGGDLGTPAELIERGWAGAAIWYNRIAAMNGAITTAVFNLPKPIKMPLLMDEAVSSNRKQNQFLDISEKFNQDMADITGKNVLLDISDKDRELLVPMKKASDYWSQHGDQQGTHYQRLSGNIVIDFINGTLGTSGVFEMRKNTNVHPLAQLSALGKGMMDAALRNAVYATASGVGANAGSALSPFAGQVASGASGFLFAMVSVTIGIAVILYYVLPFLPFIYFMFAVSGWIKSIFEAMVAMPLWALGHLRVDGEGLPGPGATNGYFLLMEIFLRPVLILFGLLAGISIFSALVNVLNQIFDLVVANTAGADREFEASVAAGTGPAGITAKIDFIRNAVDIFFYTCVYAIICYIIGLSCFKMVDLIPNNILRWMGVSVSTFQENAGDPAGELTSKVYKGSILANSQITGNVKGDLAVLATL